VLVEPRPLDEKMPGPPPLPDVRKAMTPSQAPNYFLSSLLTNCLPPPLCQLRLNECLRFILPDAVTRRSVPSKWLLCSPPQSFPRFISSPRQFDFPGPPPKLSVGHLHRLALTYPSRFSLYHPPLRSLLFIFVVGSFFCDRSRSHCFLFFLNTHGRRACVSLS